MTLSASDSLHTHLPELQSYRRRRRRRRRRGARIGLFLPRTADVRGAALPRLEAQVSAALEPG